MNPSKPPTEAVIYARFSPRRNAADCESIENQIVMCQRYCAFCNWTVLEVYSDRDVSGKTTKNRPGLEAALCHVCKIKGILLVYDLDRLVRGLEDLIKITARLDRCKAQLVSTKDKIDTTTIAGRFFLHIMGAVGELQRKQISRTTSDHMLQQMSNGRRMTSINCLPVGTMPDKSRREYRGRSGAVATLGYPYTMDCPEEQALMKRMIVLSDQGMNPTQIQRQFASEGLLFRNRPWCVRTIDRTITRMRDDEARKNGGKL